MHQTGNTDVNGGQIKRRALQFITHQQVLQSLAPNVLNGGSPEII